MWLARRPGGRVWYLYHYEGKLKKSKSLGTTNKATANRKLSKLLGMEEFAEAGGIVRGVTWDDFRGEFLGEYTGSTLTKYKNAFAYFERIARPRSIDSLTYLDAKNFKTSLMATRCTNKKSLLSHNYINTMIRCLHTAFAEAVIMGYVKKNIFSDVKQIKTTKRVPRYLTVEEVRRLKAFAAKWPHPDLHLMTLFLLHAGIRKQELLNLRWSAIDLRRGVMYLHGAEGWEPKDREEHAIGLHPDLAAVLRRRVQASPYIFPGSKKAVRNKDAVGQLFNRLYRRAGIPYTGAHINRHTFATHFPGPPKALQRILGHSDPRTTAQYAHVTPEELLAVKNLNY